MMWGDDLLSTVTGPYVSQACRHRKFCRYCPAPVCACECHRRRHPIPFEER